MQSSSYTPLTNFLSMHFSTSLYEFIPSYSSVNGCTSGEATALPAVTYIDIKDDLDLLILPNIYRVISCCLMVIKDYHRPTFSETQQTPALSCASFPPTPFRSYSPRNTKTNAFKYTTPAMYTINKNLQNLHSRPLAILTEL